MTTLKDSHNMSLPKPRAVNLRVASRSLWVDALFRLRRNRAAVAGCMILIVTVIIAVFAPVFAPKNYDAAVLADNNAAPAWIVRVFPTMIPRDQGGYVTVKDEYPLGADKLGRDLLSRIIYGARISLAVALIGPSSASLWACLSG